MWEDKELAEEPINEERERFWCDIEDVIQAAAVADRAYERVRGLLRRYRRRPDGEALISAIGHLQCAAEMIYDHGWFAADDRRETDTFDDLYMDAKAAL